jgi:hypothetical protein
MLYPGSLWPARFTENSEISASYRLESWGLSADLLSCVTGCSTSCSTPRIAATCLHPEPTRVAPRTRRASKLPTIRHLTRRGAVWYFRKRVPERFRPLGVRAVVCVSLRTTSIGEAAVWSERLLTALEATWGLIDSNMMSERPLPASAIEQVVNEVMIRELTRIILETEGTRTTPSHSARWSRPRMGTASPGGRASGGASTPTMSPSIPNADGANGRSAAG